MTRSFTYILTIALSFLLAQDAFGQNLTASKNHLQDSQQVDDYLDLLKQGYTELEIFQDLGNANFLSSNYETASFWYEKLLQTSPTNQLDLNYKALFQFAKEQSFGIQKGRMEEKKQWDAHIESHYVDNDKNDVAAGKVFKSQKMTGELSTLDGYMPAMSITKDGQTAYFSKAVYQKPLYGVFSKKELSHEIFRAEKVNGKWENITKIKVCPKYASAKHPTISEDGKRLFFASNMKGSYGKYDIYVVDILKNGKLGIVKNLGPKVNTKEDELYPNLYNGTLLFFASSGRKGYGGLDLYATQVAKSSLTASVNLGGHINSSKDDYSIALNLDKGTGYVVSNRGQNQTIAQYTVNYGKRTSENTVIVNHEEKPNRLLKEEASMEYSATAYDD
ncbi:MAG: cell envelope biogenesis protein OmpA [Bacteroidota bacterium]